MGNEFQPQCGCGHIHDSRSTLSCTLEQLARTHVAPAVGEGDHVESNLSLAAQDWYHYASALLLGSSPDGTETPVDAGDFLAPYGSYTRAELAKKLRHHVGAVGRSYLELAKNAISILEEAADLHSFNPATAGHFVPTGGLAASRSELLGQEAAPTWEDMYRAAVAELDKVATEAGKLQAQLAAMTAERGALAAQVAELTNRSVVILSVGVTRPAFETSAAWKQRNDPAHSAKTPV